jgi:hypothetical protein
VGSALVTSGLVTMAFLLALRLLIRDFFEIDIACSLFLFSTDALSYCTGRAKVRAKILDCVWPVESATCEILVASVPARGIKKSPGRLKINPRRFKN